MLAGAQGADLAKSQQYQAICRRSEKMPCSTPSKTTVLAIHWTNKKANIVNALAEDYPDIFDGLLENSGEIGAAITAADAIFGAGTGGEAAKNLVNAFGTSALSEAAAYALAAQGFPVAGQVVGAAIILDLLAI